MKTFGRILLVIAWLITFSTATGQSLNQDPTKGSPGNPLKADDTITILEQPQNDTTCLGGNAVFEVIATSPEANMWYSWERNNNEHISGGHSSKLVIENVEFADTGRYFCILANSSNDTAYTDTVRLLLKDLPFIKAKPEGPTSVAYTGEPEIYQVKHHESITGYLWKLIPETAGWVGHEMMDTVMVRDSIIGVEFSRDFTGKAGLFVEMTQGSCRTQNSDTLWIDIAGIPGSLEICIVGLDGATERCRIVWNTIDNPIITFYNIYRETNEAGVFLKLASIPADGPSVFVDSTSVPYVHTHSYQMSITDTNGNESIRGKTHTTMLLSSSLGTNGRHNLFWTHYKGYPFLTYEIYHGQERDSITYLGSVASSVSSFIVQDPLPGTVNYQIVARRDGCDPALKSDINYGETRSNINEMIVYVGSLRDRPSLLEISPNPADKTIRVRYTGTGNISASIKVLDLVGKVCGSYILDDNQAEIDIAGFAPGVYLMHIEVPDTTIIQKFVVKR